MRTLPGAVPPNHRMEIPPARQTFDLLYQAYRQACVGVEHYRLGGTAVRIAWASQALRDALCPAIAHLHTVDPAATTVIVADSVTSGIRIPPFPWRPDDVGTRGEVATASGDGVLTAYFAPSNGLSMYDGRRCRGFFWVPNASLLPPYERAAPLRTLIHWIGAAKGHRLIHAAAVGSGGTGALLAGRGGSGKSTTALLCLLAGMDFAGDDYVAVATHPQPTAFSLFGTAKVTRHTLSLLPTAASALLAAPSDETKGIVLATLLDAGRIVERLPLRAIILPRVTREAETRTRRASPAEVTLALAPTTLFQLPMSDGTVLAELSALARRLPGWVLDLGSDVRQIPEAVRSVLARSEP